MKPPPGSSTGPLRRELPVFRVFFYVSLGFPRKVLLIKNSHPSLEVPRKGASPPCSLKQDPYRTGRPFSESYFTCHSGSLIKEPSLQVSHRQRRALFRAHLHLSLNVPGQQAPSGSPTGPLWRKMPISRALFHLSVSSKRKPIYSPVGPLRREVPVSRAFFYTSSDKNKI